MKTSLAIDLAAAVVTGTPFLGRAVPEPRSVWALTLETPPAEWKLRFVKAVKERRGNPDEAAERLTLAGDLGALRRRDARDDLRRFIRLANVAVAIVDPLYLALPSSNSSDLSGQGAGSRKLLKPIVEAGAAPLLVHHFMRGAQKSARPSLGHLFGPAIAAYVRAWLLVSRREEYGPERSGVHRLAATAGNSSGECSLLNIEFDEWRWKLSVAPASPVGKGRRKATASGTKREGS